MGKREMPHWVVCTWDGARAWREEMSRKEAINGEPRRSYRHLADVVVDALAAALDN